MNLNTCHAQRDNRDKGSLATPPVPTQLSYGVRIRRFRWIMQAASRDGSQAE